MSKLDELKKIAHEQTLSEQEDLAQKCVALINNTLIQLLKNKNNVYNHVTLSFNNVIDEDDKRTICIDVLIDDIKIKNIPKSNNNNNLEDFIEILKNKLTSCGFIVEESNSFLYNKNCKNYKLY